MKVLFVQKVKALVGSEKYFLELIPALEKKGFTTEFICVYSEIDEEKTIPFIEAYKKLGLKIHVLKVKSDKSILKTLRFIRKIIKEGNFDLVHSHLIHADFWCALLKKGGSLKCDLVSTKHGYDEEYISKYGFSAKELKPNRYFKLCKFSEKHIDRSYAVSEGLMKFFIETGISKADKISFIHHGFDLPDLKNNTEGEYRFSENQLVILGRVIPFKGHKILIQALPIIKEKYPNFKLLIIGHGDANLIDELKEDIKKQNSIENVDWLGYQSNIYDYLLDSDIMIVPSIAEGFGLIFLEALNAKIPIVGFDVPATNEIIINNENGIIIEPFDTDKLGQAIVDLLNDKDKAKKLGDQGYKRLKSYFSMERMLNQTIEFYLDNDSPDNSGRTV